MPVSILNDVILSDDEIAANLRGKNARMNSRVDLNNGYKTVNIVWSRTLREFEISAVPMSKSAWAGIQAIFEITEGGAYGFLIEDPSDSTVTDGVLTEVSAGVYQVYKRYIDTRSSRYKDRIITRPRAAGFAVYNLGVPVAHTLDPNTGLVTIASEPDAEDLEWAGRFYVPVHFMDDSLEWEVARPGSETTLLVSGQSINLQEIRE